MGRPSVGSGRGVGGFTSSCCAPGRPFWGAFGVCGGRSPALVAHGRPSVAGSGVDWGWFTSSCCAWGVLPWGVVGGGGGSPALVAHRGDLSEVCSGSVQVGHQLLLRTCSSFPRGIRNCPHCVTSSCCARFSPLIYDLVAQRNRFASVGEYRRQRAIICFSYDPRTVGADPVGTARRPHPTLYCGNGSSATLVTFSPRLPTRRRGGRTGDAAGCAAGCAAETRATSSPRPPARRGEQWVVACPSVFSRYVLIA